jgi:hypothetical protein
MKKQNSQQSQITYYTIKFEKRVEGEYENELRVFDSRDKAYTFAENEWVESARIFESDEDGNEI